MNRFRWQPLLVALAWGCSATGPTMANPVPPKTESAAAASGTDRAPDRIRMAVLPLANNSDRTDLDRAGSSLADVATSELSSRPGIAIVERQRLDDVLSELRLSATAVVDSATAARAGRMLGANYMAFGSFSKLGGRWLLTMRVVRVETGQIVAAVTEGAEEEGALESMSRKAIRETVSTLTPLSPVRPEPENGPSSAESDILIPNGSPRPDAIAVIIGVRDYKSKDVPKAAYALDDARLMRDFVTRGLGFSEDNVLFAENPTKAEMEAIFGTKDEVRGKIWRLIGERDPRRTELYVYYSGHGAPGLKDKHAYLVPSDANPNYVELNGYPRDLMLANLAKLHARRTSVVLETCFSGSSDSGALITQASPLILASDAPDRPEGIDLYTSASRDEIASWYPEKGHSLFTYFFVRDMARAAGGGKGVARKDLAARITREVSGYASKKFDRNQTPEFWGDPGAILR